MGRRVSIPMTRQQALRARLVCQGLVTTRVRGVGADVNRTVSGLVSMPAKHAAHAIGLRSAATATDLDAAIDRTEVVCVRVMTTRPQLVAAADVRWLQELTSVHVERSLAGTLDDLGLTPRVIGTSMYAFADLLSDSHRMSAEEMAPHFADHGLPHEGRAYRALLALASLRGLLCHVAGGYLLTDDLLPPQPRLDQDEALVTLARRFYGGHGPSSLEDFARWSGLPLSLARRGTDAAEDLHLYTIDDLPHYGPRILLPVDAGATHLITLNDETIRPYPDLPFEADRSLPANADGVVLRGVRQIGSFRFDDAAPDGVVVEYFPSDAAHPVPRQQVL